MKHSLTKRVFALLLSLVMILGLLPIMATAAERAFDGTEKLYADLGSVDFWLNDNAVQRVYFFNNSTGESAWSVFSLAEGTVYETVVPAGTWTHVILVRCDPAYEGDNYWDDSCKWNQTGDIALDESGNFIESFTESGTAVWGIWPAEAEPELAEIPLPNGDFEDGNEPWSFTGINGEIIDNSSSSSHKTHVLNLWASNEAQVEISVSYPVKLTEGTYKFTFDVDGEDKDSLLHYAVKSGDAVLFSSDNTIVTTGWDQWLTLETGNITLTEDTEIVFTIFGTGPVGYWGHLDNLKLFGTGAIVSEGPDHKPTIAVEKVNGVDSDDFMRGTDVSSYLSIVNSGATFYDYEGNALNNQGFFDLLAEAGFNYIRLRVWNDPFDADDNGYGGGNCDVNAALQMGQWATNAGMKVLIDFHYSDFWADPGKQKVPKAWSGYTADQKAAAVDEFTYNSLKTLLDGGVNVGMVQVGNETTNSICGESAWANKAKIFSAGSAAIRRISEEYSHPILVAIHFTNPERSGNYASQAQNLSNYNVDYDVFASSWYPYWHGTTSNLTSVLKQVADTYGKQVVVAETSWAWTLEDGDGHDNTVRNGNNSANNAYPFSVQGQADELVSAAKAVTAVGSAGVGVFYWENAWIPVQYAYDENGTLDQTILASNKAKWEQFGSGWASSYAAEYDPNDAGKWFGGSAVDNQAMFDFTGKALDSLWTWEYMMTGTEEAVEQEIVSIEAPELVFEQGATLSLPSEIAVTYLVGGVAYESVTWDLDDISDVDMNTPGVYQIHGTVATQLGDREIVATVTVNYPNLLLNPSFEESDMSMYTYENGSRTGDDPHTGSRSFHFYNSAAKTVKLEQSITLEPGTYSFSLFAQGDAKGSEDIYIYVTVGDNEPVTQSFALAGWAVWQNPEVEFEVTEAATVTVGLHLAFGAGGWGTIDDLYLGKKDNETPDPETPVYYLVGSMNDWTASEEFKLTAGENEGEFVLTGVELAAGAEVKIVDQPNDLWYPNGSNYVVAEAGTYDVSFYPAGTDLEGYTECVLKLTKQEEQPPEPETEYYLFGWINGADYPAEGLGDYKFADGKLTATFEEDSYVAVQTNTGKQYMTDGWLGSVNTATLYDKTTLSNPDKLKVPGGVELEFTLTVNEDGTLTLSYTGADIPQPQDPIYYLVGSMNEWTASEEFKLTAGENEGEFVLTGVELAAGAEIKVKDEPNDLWYPNGSNYVVAEAGTYDVSFYPAGTDLEGYTEGVLKLTKQEPQPEPMPIDIYYVDEVGLNAVYYFAFDMLGGDPSAEWPGAAPEGLGQDRNGHEVYKITLDASVYTHVIFNDGNEWQTVDLPFGEDAGVGENTYIVYFGNSNETDDQGHYKAWPAEDVEKIAQKTDPTCTEPGQVVYESFVTGQQRTEALDALGHDWGDWGQTTAPTCTEDGVETRVCARCGETETRPIPHVEHEWSEWTETTMPTCTEPGEESRMCARCQETETRPIAPLGHDWDEGNVTKAPTMDEEGEMTYTCRRCGETRTEPIDKLDFQFDDVQDPDKYYYIPVYWAYYHEPQITAGVTDKLFKPGNECTRAQIVTFLWAAAGKPEPETTENPFTDIKEGAWYYKAVLWAVESGITEGTGNGLFSPKKVCNRATAVTFLWAAAGKPEPETTENPFTDVKAGSWYEKAVLWAVENHITSGTGNGKFSPVKDCTRGQIVTFLYAYHNITIEKA